MDDNTAKVLLAVVPMAISSSLTWYLTARSQRLLYSQKLWDKKAQVYDNIAGALATLSSNLGDWEDHFNQAIPLTTHDQNKLSGDRKAAIQTLRRASAIGDFFISTAAADALRKCAGSLREEFPGNVVEQLDRDIDAVDACMAVVRTEARTDLKFGR